MTISVSAVLCTYNEDRRLKECLDSISWTNEIVVCDMGSTDNSVKIAKECHATVVAIPHVPCVEFVREKAVSFCKEEWILFTDPDFVFPKEKVPEILEFLEKHQTITCISMRYINFYCGKMVNYGQWKPGRRYPIMFKKTAMSLPAILHNGFKLLNGEIYEPPNHIFLKHYWIDSESQFYEKHKRYLFSEGVRRIQHAIPPSALRLYHYILKSTRRFLFGGILEGKNGWDLHGKSIWYEAMAERQQRLDMLTGRVEDIQYNANLNVNKGVLRVIYNYYKDANASRADELDYCMSRLIENPLVTEIMVFSESPIPFSHDKIKIMSHSQARPDFALLFSACNAISGENDVNVVLNTDCFFNVKGAALLLDINKSQAYCCGRYDIPQINPLIPFPWQKKVALSDRTDMQDCWVIRGKMRDGMQLDFSPGTPGCDNRLAYELEHAGYHIVNPMKQLVIYHNHTTKVRRYTEKERVPGPYAFPAEK